MSEVEFSTLYAANKQLYQKITPNEKTINAQLEELEAWLPFEVYNYFMLLCRERNDYTVFHIAKDKKNLTKELKEVLESRGTIIDIINQNENNYTECWVRDNTQEVFMYMFFPCDEWIVEV